MIVNQAKRVPCECYSFHSNTQFRSEEEMGDFLLPDVLQYRGDSFIQCWLEDSCELLLWTLVLRCSIMSDSLWPHGLYPARLLCPWDFPGKNNGMGCHFLLHGILSTQGSNLLLGRILYHWAIWEAHLIIRRLSEKIFLKGALPNLHFEASITLFPKPKKDIKWIFKKKSIKTLFMNKMEKSANRIY